MKRRRSALVHVMHQASTCSVCASTEGRMKGGMTDPTEMGAIMWQKAFFKANMELMVEKLKKRMESRWGPATDKAD